jgi:hypothetical protein
MEFDLNVQSEAAAEYNLNAIKDYSPFNEYVIGEKVCLFGEEGTGTQIFIWNLDRWGKEYTLQWNSEKTDENPVGHDNRDILIRSKRVRSRPGQTSSNVCNFSSTFDLLLFFQTSNNLSDLSTRSVSF